MHSNQIIGQDRVKKSLSNLFEVFIKSQCKIKPHFILTGQSGSGKTILIKSLAKDFDIQFLEINGAQLTKEGMTGNSLSKALTPLLNYDHNQPIIIFVDEFDKLLISGNTNNSVAQDFTVGVQNEFLKAMEDSEVSVFGNYGHFVPVSMKNVLFVFSGAFNGEQNLTPSRLKEIGIKNEFLGRVGLLFNTEDLSLNDLKMILQNSPLLEQYLEIFNQVSKEEVVDYIFKHIEKSFKRNSVGARMINTFIHQYFISGEIQEDDHLYQPKPKSMMIESKPRQISNRLFNPDVF